MLDYLVLTRVGAAARASLLARWYAAHICSRGSTTRTLRAPKRS
jgi:hypothetical protein